MRLYNIEARTRGMRGWAEYSQSGFRGARDARIGWNVETFEESVVSGCLRKKEGKGSHSSDWGLEISRCSFVGENCI